MDTKMKGLLKGLRYISQIFEGEDKEPEMQIGFPTDVKHVAHIGWDGPSTTAPSWMNEYRSTPLSASSVGGETAPAAEFKPTGAGADSTSGGGPPRPRTSRRKDSSSSNPDSPGRGDSSKPSRRRPSTGAVPADSLPRESTAEGSRRGRRNHSSSEGSGSAGPGLDSQPSQHADHPAAVPKQSRRRKTKESSSSGGSSRSRNRASDSTHGSAPELMPLPSMPEREEYHGGF